MTVSDLRCEYRVQPRNVCTDRPLLSWSTNIDNESVTAWRVQVQKVSRATEAVQLTWDSGWRSDGGNSCRYSGDQLESDRSYRWSVSLKAADGTEAIAGSDWRTGLRNENDWTGANWIGAPGSAPKAPRTEVVSPRFAVDFDCNEEIIDAAFYIVGLGYFQVFVNGQKEGAIGVGQPVSAYDKSVYVTYLDITRDITVGPNILGVELGNGFFNVEEPDAWDTDKASWRAEPEFLAVLLIEGEGGSRQGIVSDSRWRCLLGPIGSNGFRTGETLDGRKEKQWQWTTSGESSWQPAIIRRSPGGIIRSSLLSPVEVCRTFPPLSVKAGNNGTILVDAGLNATGWIRTTFGDLAEGQEIAIRYGERLDRQGELDTRENSRFVHSPLFQTDRFISSGNGHESYEPSFTYHGFRYAEVSGIHHSQLLNSEIRSVHSALERRGWFHCSDPMVNSVYDCAVRSIENNWFTIPTDCSHREKLGWTADGWLTCEAALYLFNAVNDYRKWLQDIVDAQRPDGSLPGIAPTGGWGFQWGNGPAWDSALFQVADQLYRFTGDQAVVAFTLSAMWSYINHLDRMADDGLVNFGLGDWCAPDGFLERCPTELSDSCHYYSDLKILQRLCTAAGFEEKARDAATRSRLVRSAVVAKFFEGKTDFYNLCASAIAIPLYYHVLPRNLDAEMTKWLARRVREDGFKANFGVLGAKCVLRALTERGYGNLASNIVRQHSYPGWGYEVSQGATTLWENWDGSKSLDHAMFGSVADWMFHDLLGIQFKEGTRNTVVTTPALNSGIADIEGSLQTLAGEVSVRWRRPAASRPSEGQLTIPYGVRCLLQTGKFRLTKIARLEAVNTASEQPQESSSGFLLGPGTWRILYS